MATQVAGAAAHELGQPLTTIMLSCQLLNAVSADSPDFEKTLLAIKQQCDEMNRVLDSLHNVEKYDTVDYSEDLTILNLSKDDEKVSE